MFSDIMHGIMITMSPDCLLALCIGAMFGTVVGALPGLGTAVAITICVAASSPFLTPVGSGTNTLIVRPGNLKFMDFFRPGLGLTVVILIVSMIFIPIFWPL